LLIRLSIVPLVVFCLRPDPHRGRAHRISFENKVSVASGGAMSELNVTSAVTLIDGGYQIEAAFSIPGLQAGKFLGFDLQVNDGQNGTRIAVHTWQDETGDSWRDTRNWGMAALQGD
jgi:endo-1,4-beta-xylanase